MSRENSSDETRVPISPQQLLKDMDDFDWFDESTNIIRVIVNLLDAIAEVSRQLHHRLDRHSLDAAEKTGLLWLCDKVYDPIDDCFLLTLKQVSRRCESAIEKLEKAQISSVFSSWRLASGPDLKRALTCMRSFLDEVPTGTRSKRKLQMVLAEHGNVSEAMCCVEAIAYSAEVTSLQF